MTTQKTTAHAELLARFTAADAQAIRDIPKQKKISIAKAIAQHKRDATPVVPEVAPRWRPRRSPPQRRPSRLRSSAQPRRTRL